MTYSVSFLAHLRAIKECLPKFEASARCNLRTGGLEIRARGRCVELHPQFAFPQNGSIAYSLKLEAHMEFFVGWRPYVNRVWPLSYDKKSFKDFCAQSGLRTPRSWQQAQSVSENVLVKHATSSFCRGISGPFTQEGLKGANRALQQGEFFEEFIQGDIVKVWYWNANPVALEVLPMPTVTGDGSSSLRKLLGRKAVAHLPGNDWDVWAAVAAFQGLTLDSVIAAGKKVLVDFRYLSSLHPFAPNAQNLNVLADYEGTPLMNQLRAAGKPFWEAIPAEIRPDTLYSIDAMIDGQRNALFLEMNCNPAVHPDAYAAMFESLFGAAVAVRPPGSAAVGLKIAAA
ncbi:MAG TPA: hypothetical protein VGM84_05120 [Steroidobacteraceae bacterium]|jgi:hypothetical protein